MQIVSQEFVYNKKVLLRLDLDVPIIDGRVVEDFRLQVALPTLELCLHHAGQVILMGHVGRPEGKEVPQLSVGPIVDWLEGSLDCEWNDDQLKVLENLRFDSREDQCDPGFARELAGLGEVYINEAFAAHHPAASTTVLPTLLPHAAGLRFAREVEVLTGVRENPKRPLVAIIGGAKIEDKLGAIEALSKMADAVLVGGKLALQITQLGTAVASNVMVGMLSESGLDLAESTIEAFTRVVKNSKQVVWAGPVGKYEDGQGNEGNRKLAGAILESGTEVILGGGDTIAALGKLGLLDKLGEKGFVSTGGGAMLKLLTDGTLPSLEALR